MEKLLKKIANFPNEQNLHLNPKPSYKSDEWGMNRHLTIESDDTINTTELKFFRVAYLELKQENDDFHKSLNEINDICNNPSGNQLNKIYSITDKVLNPF